MDSQQSDHGSPMLTWMILIFLPFQCSGMDSPTFRLENTVFVGFKGEDLTINGALQKPANQTKDVLTCADPSHRQIYSCDIQETGDSPETEQLLLELENLSTSGEYHCQYKAVQVHWFLRVRAEGFKEVRVYDYTVFIVLGVLTGLLVVFSVVGSVYVFRGHWKVKKQPQNQEEEKTQNETGEDNVNVTAQPSSFYASLDTRPRSIYDVLDHSAANEQPGQKKAKPKKKEPKKVAPPDTEQPDEGTFECVYENF